MSFFCTFEGIEACGKSLQATLLYQHIFLNKNIQSTLSREPGGTVFAEKVRTLLKDSPEINKEQQFLLFHAARIDHMEKVIRPALDRGEVIISDRFIDSTRVYQNEIKTVEEWEKYYDDICDYVCYPDLTFLIDIPAEVAQERINKRKGVKDHWDSESLNELETKRNLFLSLSKRFKRIKVIDGTQSVKNITEKLIDTFNSCYKK